MSDAERPGPHESLPDNFGVDFNCDINALYARLTEKSARTHCRLSSNWKDISDVGDYFVGNTYDIFGSIGMYLSSSLKILSVPGIEDRNSKIIWAEANFSAGHPPWESKVAEVIQESTKLGIDLSFVDPDPNLEPSRQKGWLVPQNPELKWAIGFTTYRNPAFNTNISLEYPFREHLDLEGHQTVQNILQNMSSVIEHMIRVCYAVEGKMLPEKRLNFFPYVEPEKAKEMLAFATCSYCGSNYSKLHVKCPSCGAREPLSH